MQIYDAHSHLAATKWHESSPRAIAAITPNQAVALANYRQQNPQVKIGIGLHPWYLPKDLDLIQLEKYFIQLIKDYHFDFIGEFGLDQLKPQWEIQLSLCVLQLKLAQQFDLPVVLHCVHAYNELLMLLTQFPPRRGMLHAYNNSAEFAAQLWKRNIYIGVGRTILKPNSRLAQAIPLIAKQQIVIESDAPYMLLPNQKQATPNNCQIYAEQLARVCQQPLDLVIQQVNHNWLKLFNFKNNLLAKY